MSRKKGTRIPRTQQKSSDPLPAGRQTGDGLSEEFIFYEWTDSFFTDGMVKSLQGTSNVLLVASNLSPDTDDKNVGLLACELAEALGAYAVVNCQRYRRPIEGDPTPEELQLSGSPKPSKKNIKIMQLRQDLWDETGGIPVNLDSFSSASTAAYDYVEAIWMTAAEIGDTAIPLALFLCGIDDAKADEFGLDVAVGAGYLLKDKEQVCERDTGSAGGAFVEELIGRLSRLRDGIRVRDGVEGYALDGDEVAGALRSEWAYERNNPSGDAFRAEDAYSVLLAIRFSGFRDNEENLKRMVEELAGTISGLNLFKSWQSEKMAKKATKKPKEAKAEKETVSVQTKKTAASGQPSGAQEMTIMPEQPAGSEQVGVSLISQEKFQEKLQALRAQATITNDKDLDVPFEGEPKEAFIAAFEQAYPVIERALGSMHELGTFLSQLREKLKPHKLYYRWLEYAGIPERTASNYVQVHERYADSLPKFAYLGIKKLLTASRLKDCADYVEKNEEAIAEQSAAELEQLVKALRSTKKRTETGRGRKPTYIEIGKSRIRPSMDGTRLVVEGITKRKQAELIEAIKSLLS